VAHTHLSCVAHAHRTLMVSTMFMAPSERSNGECPVGPGRRGTRGMGRARGLKARPKREDGRVGCYGCNLVEEKSGLRPKYCSLLSSRIL